MKKTIIAVALAVSMPTMGSATVLSLDGGWTAFSFAGVGSAWSTSFTFDVAAGTTAYFVVTDAYCAGDRFSFSVNGVSVGMTSSPYYDGTCTDGTTRTTSADTALAGIGSVTWSHGELALTEGSYTITGSTVASPFGSGGAFAQLSSSSLTDDTIGGDVPEPTTLALVALGLVGFGLRRGRKAI